MKPTTISPVRQLDELLAAMPAVLGYRPRESLVLAVCSEKVLRFTARFDVDWFLYDPQAVLDPLLHALAHHDGVCFLLGYSSDHELVRVSLLELAALVGDDRIVDIAYTDGQRWWSLCCPGDCCPEEGKPFDFDTAQASVEAVYAGLPISRERAEIVASVAGAPELDQRVHAGVVHAARAEIEANPQSDWLGQLLDLRVALQQAPRALDEVEIARFEVVMDDPDALVEMIARVTHETAESDAELFGQLVAGCLDRYAPSLLGLLGLASWLSGGGPVLTAATDRLLSLEPCHPLAALLSSVLAQAVPPTVWADPHWEFECEAS